MRSGNIAAAARSISAAAQVFQSLALREHGYEVLAIDASEKLLGRLAGRAGDRGIADFDAVIVTDLVHVRTGGLAIEMELRGRMCTLSAVRRN